MNKTHHHFLCALCLRGPRTGYSEHSLQMYNLHQISLELSTEEMHRAQAFSTAGRSQRIKKKKKWVGNRHQSEGKLKP